MPATRASYYRELFQFILEQAYSVSIASSQLSLLALYWRAFGPIFETRVAVGVMAACSSAWFLCRVRAASRPRAFYRSNEDNGGKRRDAARGGSG